jgi:hypothetical protein
VLSGPHRAPQSWTLPGGSRDWAMAELRDAEGELLAVSNPVFVS